MNRGPRARERGASSVEYALLLSLIAGVILSVLLVLGPDVVSLYQKVLDEW